MPEQNYTNYIRFYPPHHFIFYPIVFSAAGFCLYLRTLNPDQSLIWICFSGVFFLIAWLSYLMRQHYALTNQNRIVRLEMRLRYFILTQKSLETIENELSFAQLSALRFAGNSEFLSLLQKAVDENLSADEIKKSIKNWIPDEMRV